MKTIIITTTLSKSKPQGYVNKFKANPSLDDSGSINLPFKSGVINLLWQLSS